ncbi:MAG: spore coat protein [Ruminococcus sp.]|nr:spore coat protein [Ruminococcus sp.]
MDDKQLMEGVLLLEKGVCDLYMHGTIESSTNQVHQTFSHALDESLRMQRTLYDKMQAKGWYPTDRAEMTKVSAVKKKYQTMG